MRRTRADPPASRTTTFRSYGHDSLDLQGHAASRYTTQNRSAASVHRRVTRKPALVTQRNESLAVVLVGAFRPDRLARLERNAFARHVHHLPLEAHQMHLHATGRLVEEGVMPKSSEVEVGMQLAIEASEHVEIEAGGDTRRIVVRRVEGTPHPCADRRQAPARRRRRPCVAPVAGRRRPPSGESCRSSSRGRRRRVARAVAGRAVAGAPCSPRRPGARASPDIPPRCATRPRRAARARCRSARTPRSDGARAQGVEQVSNLDAGPAPVLDEHAIVAGERGDVARARPHHLELGSRQVVLGELGDAFEQRRAGGVVEQLRWQRLGHHPETLEHLRAQPGRDARRSRWPLVARVHRPVEWRGHRRTSASVVPSARRMPLNCQRASEGKKLRYDSRACDRGVAHDAPRSTH